MCLMSSCQLPTGSALSPLVEASHWVTLVACPLHDHAVTRYGHCRMAAELGLQAGAKGPGSLRVEMLDALHNLTLKQIETLQQVCNHAS